MAFESIKSVTLMRDLKDRLKARLTTSTITEGQDAEGYPTLLILPASPTDLTANILLRMAPVSDNQAKTDALGMPQRVFTPHQLDILQQKTDADVVVAQGASLNAVIFEASRQGVILQLSVQADGTDGIVKAADLATADKTQKLQNLWAPLNGDV